MLYANTTTYKKVVEAKQKLERYLDNVLSATFNICTSEVNRCVHSNSVCQPPDHKIVGVPLQSLREMRHIELLKKHCGRVVTCEECKMSWDTAEIVNSVV
jgi:hypothetical protein